MDDASGFDGRRHGMVLGGRRFLLSLAIFAACLCLALGITLPIIRLTKFMFLTNEYSLLDTVKRLMKDGQRFLAICVLVFSIIMPILKLLYLMIIAVLPVEELIRQRRRLTALEWLGRWSMHDVLVLSLTIFYIKNSGIYDARSLSGAYFFTFAVVFMILGYSWIRRDVKLHEKALAAKLPPRSVEPPTERRRRRSIVRNFFLSLLIICAIVCFVLGVYMPSIRFTTVYVWTNQHSILTIIWALYANDELFLCFVIVMFSVFFPFLKLFYLLNLMISPDISPEFRKKSINTMELLGRFSMTDVMVLALIIFYVNSQGYTDASVQPGIYFFTASIILTMLAYGWAHTPPRRVAAPAPATSPARG